METELNTFFPFDPYKLPLSLPYIDAVYREWASVALDEDEEEEEEEDDVPDERLAMHSPGDELGRSFEGMSISPIRPTPHAKFGSRSGPGDAI